MLKKANRLKTRFEFNITRKYGVYYSGELVHIYALKPKNYSGPTKFGIVISNKFHKSAVKRNRTKRLFREAIKKESSKLENLGLWIVIHPKFSALDKTYEEISTDFSKTIQKIPLA